ncbi:hypothetical protein F5X96DRAFT_692558 [Biscogniauxia mediterranea]|nr:hypothetical protein F5X96DRAFT_692558 [Biscogniauxia mediterranea]
MTLLLAKQWERTPTMFWIPLEVHKAFYKLTVTGRDDVANYEDKRNKRMGIIRQRERWDFCPDYVASIALALKALNPEMLHRPCSQLKSLSQEESQQIVTRLNGFSLAGNPQAEMAGMNFPDLTTSVQLEYYRENFIKEFSSAYSLGFVPKADHSITYHRNFYTETLQKKWDKFSSELRHACVQTSEDDTLSANTNPRNHPFYALLLELAAIDFNNIELLVSGPDRAAITLVNPLLRKAVVEGHPYRDVDDAGASFIFNRTSQDNRCRTPLDRGSLITYLTAESPCFAWVIATVVTWVQDNMDNGGCLLVTSRHSIIQLQLACLLDVMETRAVNLFPDQDEKDQQKMIDRITKSKNPYVILCSPDLAQRLKLGNVVTAGIMLGCPTSLPPLFNTIFMHYYAGKNNKVHWDIVTTASTLDNNNLGLAVREHFQIIAENDALLSTLKEDEKKLVSKSKGSIAAITHQSNDPGSTKVNKQPQAPEDTEIIDENEDVLGDNMDEDSDNEGEEDDDYEEPQPKRRKTKQPAPKARSKKTASTKKAGPAKRRGGRKK